MALELVKLDSETLPGIADAIRAKTGGTALLLPSEMAAAIAGIPTGGSLPALTKPAAESDVLAGKEYIDGNGDKKTGTLVVADSLFVNEVYLEGIGVGAAVNVESSVDGSTKDLTLPEPNLIPENIKSGVMIYGCTGNAKILRVETGTITPAVDTQSITIPCSDGAKAFVLIPNSDVISAVEGQKAKRYVTTAVANFAGSIDGAPNTAMRVWNLRSYTNAGRVSTNTDGVKLLSSNYFYPGTYRWTAYYWEDDA